MDDLITSHHGLSGREFRDAIYRGAVIRLPPSPASRQLVTQAWNSVQRIFGEHPRCAQFQQNAEEFFRNAGGLRRELYLSDSCRQSIAGLIAETGSAPELHVYDPVRLRVVTVGGHLNDAAAPVYYVHRDTWYSNPQTQITWWLPLHHVTTKETFEFLPDCFERAVDNDSEVFDYGRWTRQGTDLKIGWQDPDAGKRERYPQLREPIPGQRRIGFSAGPGEVIVFSGQHLHQTVPIETGGTRFSIDFRTVHLGDHRSGLGPVNVDNRSTGDALDGHVALAEAKQGDG